MGTVVISLYFASLLAGKPPPLRRAIMSEFPFGHPCPCTAKAGNETPGT